MNRWVWWVMPAVLAGCAQVQSRPPAPLADITACRRSPVERIGRPGGPRTPPARDWLPGCDQFAVYRLPAPTSAAPARGEGFRAGFAEVDITPPPGLGTMGWGSEAQVARGFRNRLFARAMVLQDRNGETVAFVVLDLDMVSMILHREVARRVHDLTRSAIGADRLIMSATHTHSGPGNFLSAWTLNVGGSTLPFYDHAFVEWMSERIARTVADAYDVRTEARIAWGMRNVWGYTTNRSMPAVERDADVLPFPLTPPLPAPPRDSAASDRTVNPRWSMLAVQVRRGGEWVLGGTYNIFAIHGTVMSGANDLYDADVQGVIARELRARLDGVHLVANGTEGDVRPKWPLASRCPLPVMGYHPRPAGPRTPVGVYEWIENDAATRAACVEASRPYLEWLGAALAAEGASIHADLGGFSSDVSLAVGFETVPLTRDSGSVDSLCPSPQVGGALVAGGVDGPSRFKDWRAFGLLRLGIGWGAAGRTEGSHDCQRPKRVTLSLLERHPIGRYRLPEFGQFAVVRIGDTWIGAVPAEATTVTGRQMLAELRRGAAAATGQSPDAMPADRFVILGLANGYLNYVATEAEYDEQLYEGGATLYGPHSATFMASRLRGLAESIQTPRTDRVGEILVRPGPEQSHLQFGPAPSTIEITSVTCTPTSIVVTWRHDNDARLVPADGTVVRFVTGGLTVEDGQTAVEVETDGSLARWKAQWRPTTTLAIGAEVRVEFPRWPRAGGRCVVG